MIVLYDKAEHLVNQAPDNKTIFNIATQTPSNTTRIVTAPPYKTNRRHKKICIYNNKAGCASTRDLGQTIHFGVVIKPAPPVAPL